MTSYIIRLKLGLLFWLLYVTMCLFFRMELCHPYRTYVSLCPLCWPDIWLTLSVAELGYLPPKQENCSKLLVSTCWCLLIIGKYSSFADYP